MTKAILYTYPTSVWATAADLAVSELCSDVKKMVLNLANGDNFDPAFITLNPNATLPTLEADGQVYTNTTDVVSYLVQTAPVKVEAGSDLIALIHEDEVDPNFAKMLSRNEHEFKRKATNPQLLAFLSNRQNALKKFSETEAAAPFRSFYQAKLASNGGLMALYQSKAPEAAKLKFYKRSNDHWANLLFFINDTLPEYLPESGFIGGERPGEDDFHVAAWMARIVSTLGGTADKDGYKVLEIEQGDSVPERFASYWGAWSVRKSWKTCYSNGLH